MLLHEILSGGPSPFDNREGQGLQNFPYFNVVNDSKTASFVQNTPIRLGTIIADRYGNLFQYVRAVGALAEGQVVSLPANTTGALVTADATGDNTHVFKTNLTAGTGVDSEKGNFLVFASDTSLSRVIFHILGNTSGANSYITVSKKDIRFARGGFDGSYNGAPGANKVGANAVVAHIYRPHRVSTAAASDINPCGVAMGTITDGNNTIVQVHGLAQVLAIGSTKALTDGGPAVVGASSTGGAVTGPTATELAAELQSHVGVSKMATSAAILLHPVLLQLFGKLPH